MQKIFTPEFLAAVKSTSKLANNGNNGAQALIRRLACDFGNAMEELFDCLSEKGDYEKGYAAEQFDSWLYAFRLNVVTLGFMREAMPAWKAMQEAKEAAEDGQDFPDADSDEIEEYLLEAAPAFAFRFARAEHDAVKRLFDDIIKRFYSFYGASVDFQKEAPAAYAAMREAFFKAYGKRA